MNCKPHDIAIVVRSDDRRTDYQLGMIVKLGGYTISHPYQGVPCWVLEKPIKDHIGILNAIADECLRPISGLPDVEDTDIEQPIKEVA